MKNTVIELPVRLEALENSEVVKREDLVAVNGNTVIFSGVSLQTSNRTGGQRSINYAGSLIVGYHGQRNEGSDNNSGSHNVIIGANHYCTSHSGLVAGEFNTLSDPLSIVICGGNNTASGNYSTVKGAPLNVAYGVYSAVVGGEGNNLDRQSSVASGSQANGAVSTVSGGLENLASDNSSTVGGVRDRTTSGFANWSAGTLKQGN